MSQPQKILRRSRRAFTLVEVLMASTISTIVMGWRPLDVYLSGADRSQCLQLQWYAG